MTSLFFSIALVHLIALMSLGPDFFFVSRTAMSQFRVKPLFSLFGVGLVWTNR